MSDSLWPHGLQHTKLPCPSPSPGTCSNSCPLSQWCHPTTSSFVVPFSCLHSFSAWGSFPMSKWCILSLPWLGRLPCPGVPQGPAQFHHLCLDVLPQDVHPAPSLRLGLCLDTSSQSHFPWPHFLEISISFFISLCSIQRILYSFLNNRSLNHVDMEGMCVRKDNYNFHVDFPRRGGSVPHPWIVQGLMVRKQKKPYNNRCMLYLQKSLSL